MATIKKADPKPAANERAAARHQAKERLAQEAAAAALKAVLDKIASLEESDKTNAERIHAIVTRVAPSLTPKLLYGSPAYANADGKPVLFYQQRARVKARYGNLAFFGPAHLDRERCGPPPGPSPNSQRPTRRPSRSSSARRSAPRRRGRQPTRAAASTPTKPMRARRARSVAEAEWTLRGIVQYAPEADDFTFDSTAE